MILYRLTGKEKDAPPTRTTLLQYLLSGVPLHEYYGWKQEIYAPCDGIIVKAEDGYAERERTNLRLDLLNARRNARYFDPRSDTIQTVAGNYSIMKCDDHVYALLCHLQTGSVHVTVGQQVKRAK